MSKRVASSHIGLTRWRDLIAVALVAAGIGYLLVRLNYHRIPPLPRLAGLPAALIGVAEGIFGVGLRRRIRGHGPAIQPLAVARVLSVAKATTLAAAAFGGLWIGLLVYVLPLSGQVLAAADDRTTGIVGLAGAAVMLAGGLLLERCCVAPPEDQQPPSR